VDLGGFVAASHGIVFFLTVGSWGGVCWGGGHGGGGISRARCAHSLGESVRSVWDFRSGGVLGGCLVFWHQAGWPFVPLRIFFCPVFFLRL